MDTKTYEKARRQGVRAIDAYRWATTPAPDLDLDWRGDSAETERDGYLVRVTVEPDDFMDLSWLGTFTDDPDGAVPNPDWNGDSRTYRYFVPTYTLEERRRDLSALGWAKGPAEQEARRQIEQDARRAVDLREYVIGVKVSREGVELGSAYIGGCDFDGLEEAEQMIAEYDLIGEAITEANETLGRLCNGRPA